MTYIVQTGSCRTGGLSPREYHYGIANSRYSSVQRVDLSKDTAAIHSIGTSLV